MRGYIFHSIILLIVSVGLAGCLAKSSADEDYHPGIGTPRLTVSSTQADRFTSTVIEGYADIVMTLTNRGSGQVTRMSASSLSAPIAFKGGTFPGTGGDCGTTLDAGASCNFVIRYTPTSTSSTSQAITVTYYSGSGTSQKSVTETVSLTGALGTSGTLDTQTTASGTGYWYEAVGTSHDTARAATLDCSGKLLVAGEYFSSSNFTYDMLVARYETDGSLDTSWGTAGQVIVNVSGNDYVDSIAVGSDCLIYLAGGRNNSQLKMVSLNADGTLNTAFSGDGMWIVSMGFLALNTYTADHMVVMSDGYIILGGWGTYGSDFIHFLARISPAGARDTFFGGGGRYTGTDTFAFTYGYTSNFLGGLALSGTRDIIFSGESLETGMTPTVHGVLGKFDGITGSPDFLHHADLDAELSGYNGLGGIALDDNGKYVVAYHTGLLRFNTDGTLDNTFNNEAGAGGLSVAGRLEKTPAGKYVRIGSVSSVIYLVQYNSDGTLDTSFGTSGTATTTFGASNLNAYGSTVMGNGKLITVGNRSNGSNWDWAVARFWP